MNQGGRGQLTAANTFSCPPFEAALSFYALWPRATTTERDYEKKRSWGERDPVLRVGDSGTGGV
ncbi:MAG: hypothetical protein AUI93_05090 [Crenarchaeota archaeon 13_1_40CM_3_52_10]|nr:MAG: hypothetical protein AUI93_05090 [Crenarchaeota archaeon 13_1_40CM_3_52_10]